ncbi:MAG: response regulator [Deltaproteobacteria bacterium]|nr:response regulator [Deltaproteobacteria bacterium]
MAENSLLAGKRILVVDDEADILEILEELLSMCEVVTAGTYEEAKALLKSEDFDMAVLDIMGVDGYGLLEIAKQRGIPAAMLTAHAFTPKNLVRSIRQGALSYIPKEEISNIAVFLEDILKARKEGKSPWEPWQQRLPSSYFEKRWGAAWRDTEDEFWTRFKASVRAKRDANH